MGILRTPIMLASDPGNFSGHQILHGAKDRSLFLGPKYPRQRPCLLKMAMVSASVLRGKTRGPGSTAGGLMGASTRALQSTEKERMKYGCMVRSVKQWDGLLFRLPQPPSDQQVTSLYLSGSRCTAIKLMFVEVVPVLDHMKTPCLASWSSRQSNPGARNAGFFGSRGRK